MNFEDIDIVRILKSSYKNRFQDFTPQDFEDFISLLFEKMGYSVEQTNYSGDFGADLIVSLNEVKTAIQVKRYNETNKVGVSEINQVIGARDYYKCEHALIISTSSYTAQGKQLAAKTNVNCWEWSDLVKAISEIFWDNKDYYSFYGISNSENNNGEKFYIEIVGFESGVELKRKGYGSIIYVSVKNISEENISVRYTLPTLITQDNHQIECNYYLSSKFRGGIIYSGCKIQIGFIFLSQNVRKIENGDKLILTLFESIGKSSPIERVYTLIYESNNKEDNNINGDKFDTNYVENNSTIDSNINIQTEIPKDILESEKQVDKPIYLNILLIIVIIILVIMLLLK